MKYPSYRKFSQRFRCVSFACRSGTWNSDSSNSDSEEEIERPPPSKPPARKGTSSKPRHKVESKKVSRRKYSESSDDSSFNSDDDNESRRYAWEYHQWHCSYSRTINKVLLIVSMEWFLCTFIFYPLLTFFPFIAIISWLFSYYFPFSVLLRSVY